MAPGSERNMRMGSDARRRAGAPAHASAQHGPSEVLSRKTQKHQASRSVHISVAVAQARSSTGRCAGAALTSPRTHRAQSLQRRPEGWLRPPRQNQTRCWQYLGRTHSGPTARRLALPVSPSPPQDLPPGTSGVPCPQDGAISGPQCQVAPCNLLPSQQLNKTSFPPQ